MSRAGLVDKFKPCPGSFRRSRRIEDNPAGLAPDEGDIGQVKAAHLIDLVLQNLVEAEIQVQSSYSLQRGVDAVEVLALRQELIPLDIPGQHYLRQGHNRLDRLRSDNRGGNRPGGAGTRRQTSGQAADRGGYLLPFPRRSFRRRAGHR